MTLSAVSELNSSNEVGFTFKITNPQNGVESTLIGVAHMANAEAMRKLNVQQIIDKSSALYSEQGADVFITSADGSRPEEVHEYTNVKYRFYPDAAITLEAWSKRIPIHTLDAENSVAERTETRAIRRTIGTDEFEKLMMQHHQATGDNPELRQTLDAWEKGDAEFTAKARNEVPYRLIAPREDRWMEILTPKLRETSKPICIAVGAAHLVGHNSLPDRLRKEGFKVERVYTTPRSHL